MSTSSVQSTELSNSAVMIALGAGVGFKAALIRLTLEIESFLLLRFSRSHPDV